MATTFGGIHCVAWTFAFPTYLEHLLWRISAVAITCTPWPCIFTLFIFNVLDIPTAVYLIVYALYVTLYVAARGILLVLMFTTLRKLSPDAYIVVSWTSLVPHL
ncbi:hypothetical protein DFJ58DRAFT_834348 [Suillus subalutaceus]|nr:uncharacterized protein DFJ58DRAFT_834348 [Suillus subalutaceus]KAG1815782.1 hypothetical protein DFJ58DRAFT_834348 [Suillus subalutaceus]